jgi:hypothetical protein
MQQALEALKQFILADYNTLVEDCSTVDLPLTPVEESHLVIGEIDLDKQTSSHVICILPQSEEYADLTIEASEAQLLVEIYIFVNKASPQKLYQTAQAYAQCLKQAIWNDSTLGDVISECKILKMLTYYGVEGSPDRQAIMLECVLSYEFNLNDE